MMAEWGWEKRLRPGEQATKLTDDEKMISCAVRTRRGIKSHDAQPKESPGDAAGSEVDEDRGEERERRLEFSVFRSTLVNIISD